MATERLVLPFDEAGVPVGFACERVTLANVDDATDGWTFAAGEGRSIDGTFDELPTHQKERLGLATGDSVLFSDENGNLVLFDANEDLRFRGCWVYRFRFDAGPIARRDALTVCDSGTVVMANHLLLVLRVTDRGAIEFHELFNVSWRSVWYPTTFELLCEMGECLHVYTRDDHELK